MSQLISTIAGFSSARALSQWCYPIGDSRRINRKLIDQAQKRRTHRRFQQIAKSRGSFIDPDLIGIQAHALQRCLLSFGKCQFARLKPCACDPGVSMSELPPSSPIPSHPFRWIPEFWTLGRQRFRSQARLMMLSMLVGVIAGVGAVVFFAACQIVSHAGASRRSCVRRRT